MWGLIFTVGTFIVLALFPAVRCAVFHPLHVLYYGTLDTFDYIRRKQYNLCHTGDLDIYCGYFGSGKTLLVQQQPNGVDLEGLARHRGSAFGRTLQPQLSQASFENLLAAEMLKTDARQNLRLWVLEDESRMIGSNHLPECLRERMTQAAIAVVEDPFEIRLERLNEEYFLRMHHDFTHAYGDEQGWQEYCEYLHHGLSAIKRRLGLQRYNELAAQLDTALTTQLTTGSTDGHLAWLVPLLKEYYDPMYRYQLEKKAEKVVFRGEWAEVAEWVKAR